jgi:3,4-dihydroxy 2-butanone 4-phosphate synthase / GTP cyclohydrolase II
MINRPFAEAVQQAVAALAAGRMIVVTDDTDREDEGDLVAAAELVTPDQMAFLVRHTSGIVCAPLSAERADELRLAPMVVDNTDVHGTAVTVSVDLNGTGTGVSATARTATVRALADPELHPNQLRRPGHVFPLRARRGGVLVTSRSSTSTSGSAGSGHQSAGDERPSVPTTSTARTSSCTRLRRS